MVSFTGVEKNILENLAETLLPPGNFLTETTAELHLMERIDEHVSRMPSPYRRLFRFGLLAFGLGSFLLCGRSFQKLSRQKRERYIERWGLGPTPFRLLFKLLQTTCHLLYYADPAISKKIGFAPVASTGVGKISEDKGVIIPEGDVYLSTDVCIIGSGAGGAVVAKELAEKGRRVVILEEGGLYTTRDFGKEPLEIVRKLYRGLGMQTTIGIPSIILPTGKAVGGTTVINSGTCFRLPEAVFENWRGKYGLQELSADILQPYFDRVEGHLGVAPTSDEVLGKIAQLFQKGLEKKGLSGTPLRRNAKDCKGSGLCCFGCPTGAKQSMEASYLPLALKHGAKIFARCRAETIIPKGRHGGEVIGDVIDEGGKKVGRVTVEARVIVVAAGTLNTPRLLRKNQIAAWNGHIGGHLTIHPAGKVIARFDEEIRGWEGVPQGFSYEGLGDEGILFEGIFTPPSFGAVNLTLPPKQHKEAMENYSRLASFGFMISDDGARGCVHGNLDGEPLIFYHLLQRDVRRAFRAIGFLTDVFLEAGAQEVYTGLRRMPIVTSKKDLESLKRLSTRRSELELAAFHPLGTCRMGSDPASSVVDHTGKIHSLENIFIADGSIFPGSLGVNPQETIMAFANRTADFIDGNFS